MSIDTETPNSSVDMDIRGERSPQCEEILHRYAPYELGPEKLFRMLSRRHVTSGNAYHLHDAGYSRSRTQSPRADACDFEATGATD